MSTLVSSMWQPLSENKLADMIEEAELFMSAAVDGFGIT